MCVREQWWVSASKENVLSCTCDPEQWGENNSAVIRVEGGLRVAVKDGHRC